MSQATFDRVYSILQTNCTAACHNSINPAGNLDLSGSKSSVLGALVNVAPDNSTALAKGYKRVYPGDARKSFLFRKINQGLDGNISLQSGEGAAEPQGQFPLSETERELIRQWIIFGASGSADYSWVRENVIADFYNGKGESRTPALPAPEPADGMQVYFGPIFLLPGEEVEFASKFPLENSEDLEVYKMNTVVNKESHHMALWKYKNGLDFLSPFGLQKLNGITDEAILFFAADVVGQWPDPLEIELPPGTALMWDANTFINIGYHILNYSDSIIAAEIYMNIYARPRQPGTIPMLSYPVRYDGEDPYGGGTNVNALRILPGSDTTFTINHYNPDSTFWYVWSLQAHTHKLGTDFNVWQRNSDGSKGSIIYDGSYDVTYSFDQGYYDWEHPPFRYFDPLLPVDMKTGLIHEARFYNPTASTVNFGLKTTDEMFVTYMYYTKTLPLSTKTPNVKILNTAAVKIYPNPALNEILVQIAPEIRLTNVSFCLYDLSGKEALAVAVKKREFTLDVTSLPKGYYLYKMVNNEGIIGAGKIAAGD
ncbi:MAG TPA: T9SS type A sorting domain-containing protein [Chitinophagales bacterium]|nr:T9SS type A sorting domain-containing protein [Chitinophagales bacterium]